jgi:hypothetical protein
VGGASAGGRHEGGEGAGGLSEPKDKPEQIEQQVMARWLARVLAGERFPDNPDVVVKREHLRLLYRDGDNTTKH